MNLVTVTFDSDEWQVVPKKATAEIISGFWGKITMGDEEIEAANAAWECALAAAPQPPVVSAEPVATKLETSQFSCFHVSVDDMRKLKDLPVGTKLFLAPQPSADAKDAALRESVLDAVADSLGDLYVCTRVWSAWGVGTMGPDDFHPAAEDDNVISSIADAVIAAMQKGGA